VTSLLVEKGIWHRFSSTRETRSTINEYITEKGQRVNSGYNICSD
jgi:hypothetical protein